MRPLHALPPREDDRHRRPRGVRRGHRPHAGRRRSLRHVRACGAGRRRLARRLGSNRGTGRRGCRRALSPSVARPDGRDPSRAGTTRSDRRHRSSDRADDSGERLRTVASARRLLPARVLRRRDPVGGAADLHREPVPVVRRDRRTPGREAARSSPRRLSRHRLAPRDSERRCRRLTGPGRRPHPRG